MLAAAATVLSGAAVLAGAGGAVASPTNQVLVQDAFSGASSSSPVIALANTRGLPCLTAGGTLTATPLPGCAGPALDPAGSGVLRLTDLRNQEATGIVYNSSFPLVKGLVAQFDLAQYGGGGNGADGISFDLAVAPPAPSALGAPGEGLGYANDPFDGPTPVDGLLGGYLGIGFDKYGNYINSGYHPTCNQTQPLTANSVGVRGPGYKQQGYCLLGYGPQDYSGATRAAATRTFRVTIDPVAKTYRVERVSGTTSTTVVSGALPTSYFDRAGVSHIGLPDRLTFAIAASTGGLVDYHEVSNVSVTTLNGPVPVLTLADSDSSGGSVPPGGAFSYTLTPAVSSSGGSEDVPGSVVVTDTLPSGITTTATPTGTGWNCAASTSTSVSCTYGGTASIPAGTALPPITVAAAVDAGTAVGTTLRDAASVISTDASAPATSSDPITVAPVAPAVTAQPADQYVTSSQDATFSAAASGDPAPTVQWQSSPDGATWTDVPSATSDTLTVSGVTVAGDDGHRYRAVYSNAGGTATSRPATLHVMKGSSTTTSAAVSGSGFVGDQRTYTATVTPAPAAIAVSGTVTFTVDGASVPACAAVPVTAGSASCTVTPTVAGDHTLVATYNGSSELSASTAAPLDDPISPVATTTTLTAGPTAPVVGQTVTYTATVSEHGPGTAPLDGTVAFTDGGATVAGCGADSIDASGNAVCTVAYAAPGAHHVTATYSGGPATGGSASDPVDVQVGKGATSTVLSTSPNPSAYGQPVALRAVVSPVAPAAAPVSGTVTFREGTTILGTAPVSGVNGSYVATLAYAGLATGSHQLTADYSGDANLTASSSAAITQSVTRLPTTLTAAPYVKVSLVVIGLTVTIRLSPSATLTITGGAPVAGQPVTFTAGGQTVCSGVTDSNGVAACSGTVTGLLSTLLNLGYVASFAGSDSYLGSSGKGALLSA